MSLTPPSEDVTANPQVAKSCLHGENHIQACYCLISSWGSPTGNVLNRTMVLLRKND
jgi:hypothetical protein